MADCRAAMHHRFEFLFRDRKRNDGATVIVDHALYIRPRLVQRGVDVALPVRFSSARIDGFAIEREFHDV